MLITVAVQRLHRDDVGSVPIVCDVCHKLQVLLTEEEFVLPILLVFKPNFLLNRVIRIVELESLALWLNIVNHVNFSFLFLRLGVWVLLHFLVFIHNLIGLIFSLVNDQISISPSLAPSLLHAHPSELFLSSEALSAKILDVKITDNIVIELIPLFAILVSSISDERVVVPRVGGTRVDDDSLKLKFVVILRVLSCLGCIFHRGLLLLFSLSLLLRGRFFLLESFLGVWEHVKLLRKFAVIVDLDSNHAVEIEFKSL